MIKKNILYFVSTVSVYASDSVIDNVVSKIDSSKNDLLLVMSALVLASISIYFFNQVINLIRNGNGSSFSSFEIDDSPSDSFYEEFKDEIPF